MKNLTAYLCDREQAWADCWTEIGPEINAGFNVNAQVQQVDVTNPNSWAKQQKFLAADLFLLVYFASEVASLGDKAAAFWNELSTKTKPGAYMLVIDNNSPYFQDFITKTIIGKHWEILTNESGKFTPSHQEEKSDLGSHLTRYGSKPKLTGNIIFWVLRRTA